MRLIAALYCTKVACMRHSWLANPLRGYSKRKASNGPTLAARLAGR
jgi:hypothetical protein